MERVDVLVVGGGQAGLALSHELSRAGVEHLVLERGRIGQSWRDRWDTFCLVTPNWTVQLPDGHYAGDDPDGFMPRDEIAAFLEGYARRTDVPIREATEVTAVRHENGGFVADTSSGQISARRVAMATGAFQRPHRPAGAASLPAGIAQLDIPDYRNADALPDGGVLVVGSGQSGCQIAEELRQAGRDVILACGRAPWFPRRIGEHDGVWWALQSGFLDETVESLPDPRARLWANPQLSGHDGGHDLNLRTLRAQDIILAGHFLGADERELRFAPDLVESARWGDEGYRRFAELLEHMAAERGLPDPVLPDPEPFTADPPERLPLAGIGSVIFAGGFRPDYRAVLPWAEAFDEMGFPLHADGESTVVPGLHFIGVHFLRKRKSSFLMGVAEDAAVVAKRIAAA
jgi:putative flavoprotein involved in K+ transport